MTYEDRLCRSLLRKNEVVFMNELDAMELIAHLPCLPKQSKEGIEAEHRERGRTRGMMKLLDEVQRRDRWHYQFVKALHHPSINKPNLAQLISPTTKSNSTDTEIPPLLNKNTPLRKLPFQVCDVLKRLDHSDGWKKIASELGFSIEDVRSIECYPDCGSCTMAFITMWSHRSDATLQTLLSVLDKIERLDILDELSRIKGMEKIKFPKSVLNCYNMGQENQEKGSYTTTLLSRDQDANKDYAGIKVGNTVCVPPEDDTYSAQWSCDTDIFCREKDDSYTMVVHPESAHFCNDPRTSTTCMCSCKSLDKQIEDKQLQQKAKNTKAIQISDKISNQGWNNDNSIHGENNYPLDVSASNSKGFPAASSNTSDINAYNGHSRQEIDKSVLSNDIQATGDNSASNKDFQIPAKQLHNFRLFPSPREIRFQEILTAKWLYLSVGGALCLNYVLMKK